MRMTDLIADKKEGKKLSADEIRFIIKGYTEGSIPDYQMSAFAMAVCFQGMDFEETAELTLAIAHSGEMVDLSSIPGIKVDKHSTGGVGDTTTLVLAPLVASVGVPVAKMTGRGLGHTGGTLDKLDSIPGFSGEMSREKFLQLVKEHGAAIAGQSGDLAPADKKLYSLRDVTATVNSIPLIASSVMSKKIAAGADAIVLDVKTGQGAFMKDIASARDLARQMVEIGRHAGRQTIAVLTDMSQPLGLAVGNSLEVKEAIKTLKGQGPADLENLCLTLGSLMLIAGKKAENENTARSILSAKIKSGEALKKFHEIITAQGGNPDAQLSVAKNIVQIKSVMNGYIADVKALVIGESAMRLGAGRLTKDSSIDLSAGILLNKKQGDSVKKDEILCEAHSSLKIADDLIEFIRNAFGISTEVVKPSDLIIEIVK